jgi:hypothetical protein
VIGILNGSVAIGSPKATLYDQRTKGPKIGMIGNGYIFFNQTFEVLAFCDLS